MLLLIIRFIYVKTNYQFQASVLLVPQMVRFFFFWNSVNFLAISSYKNMAAIQVLTKIIFCENISPEVSVELLHLRIRTIGKFCEHLERAMQREQ